MTFQNYLPSDGAVGDGQVLCWASNELGEQSVPCVFYVVPLATPHPPTDCEVGQRIIAKNALPANHLYKLSTKLKSG